MTQQIVYTGRYAGDGTGDPGKVAFDKLNANCTELYAAVAGGGGGGGGTTLNYLASTLSVDTNNFSIGGSFPSGYGQIDFILSTADVQLTGLQAGTFNGQQIWIRNSPSSTFNLNLPIESSGSAPSNRWNSTPGSLTLIIGDKVAAVYYTTLARWVI